MKHCPSVWFTRNFLFHISHYNAGMQFNLQNFLKIHVILFLKIWALQVEGDAVEIKTDISHFMRKEFEFGICKICKEIFLLTRYVRDSFRKV